MLLLTLLPRLAQVISSCLLAEACKILPLLLLLQPRAMRSSNNSLAVEHGFCKTVCGFSEAVALRQAIPAAGCRDCGGESFVVNFVAIGLATSVPERMTPQPNIALL